jgi:prepilin-type N-terminal cleavage/methylation domain-containing protein
MSRVYNINKKRGFSFIELMIAVSIFGFLSVIAVSSYANFNNRIGVDTLAHQIAQFGHEAQVSALSVKRNVNLSFPAYGIHFNMASSSQMIFFADIADDNLMYTPNGSCGKVNDECEKTIKLLKGVTITSLCGEFASGIPDSLNCKFSDASKSASSFDIVFKRPSPDANIKGKKTAVSVPEQFSTAQVVISSNKGYKRTVTFYITGQITVK